MHMVAYVEMRHSRIPLPFTNLFNGNRGLARRLNRRFLKKHMPHTQANGKHAPAYRATAPWYSSKLYIAPTRKSAKDTTITPETTNPVLRLLRKLQYFHAPSTQRVKPWEVTNWWEA
jgi:hypothetical protein